MKDSGGGRRLTRSFYARDTLTVARELLGCVLEHDAPGGPVSGTIVETEGYLEHDDEASHARFGPTERSRVMFGPPGTAYVYFIYGMHFMFNVVTEPEGKAGAVLIRALEPLARRDVMASRRVCSEEKALTSGPARLCQALAITLEQNEADLTRGPLGIRQGRQVDDGSVMCTPRIGVVGSKKEPYRFLLKGNAYVSKQFSGGGDGR